jgi:hypothetical protein
MHGTMHFPRLVMVVSSAKILGVAYDSARFKRYACDVKAAKGWKEDAANQVIYQAATKMTVQGVSQTIDKCGTSVPSENVVGESSLKKWGQPSTEDIVGCCGSLKQGCPHFLWALQGYRGSSKKGCPHLSRFSPRGGLGIFGGLAALGAGGCDITSLMYHIVEMCGVLAEIYGLDTL